MPDNKKTFLNEKLKGSPYERGGRPSTEAEQEFVLDYLQTYGRAPSLAELAAGGKKSSWGDVYTEGSTMRDLGFKDWNEALAAQQRGETYGPWAGSLIPEGSTVLTRDQKPWLRTYRPEAYPGQMERGEFIRRPTDERVPYYPDVSGIYPSYNRTPRVPGTAEEALSGMAPEMTYLSRAEDWISKRQTEDLPKLQEIESKLDEIDNIISNKQQQLTDDYASGILTKSQAEERLYNYDKAVRVQYKYNELLQQMDQLMTDDKAESILSEIQNAYNIGTPVEQMPYYEDIKNIIGANVGNLINQGMKSQEKAEQTRIGGIPGFGGYKEPSVSTGKERQDFQIFVERMMPNDFVRDWLYDNYQTLYDEWSRSGMTEDFIRFVRRYISGG